MRPSSASSPSTRPEGGGGSPQQNPRNLGKRDGRDAGSASAATNYIDTLEQGRVRAVSGLVDNAIPRLRRSGRKSTKTTKEAAEAAQKKPKTYSRRRASRQPQIIDDPQKVARPEGEER